MLQRAAEKFDNVLLAPAATAAVSDEALPVVIWGVKAARNLIAGNLDLQPAVRNAALLDGVLSAVKRFPTSGAVAEDAYEDFAGKAITSSKTRGGCGAVRGLADELRGWTRTGRWSPLPAATRRNCPARRRRTGRASPS